MLRFTNNLKLMFLTVCMGATTGAVVWCFLKLVGVLYTLCWTTLPDTTGIPWSPVFPCVAGGLALGLLHRKYGDYPEELPVVLAQVKTSKHYDYSHMLVLLITALIPLAIGASVGPEAGLTGIIVGLCYWVSDNVKYAREHTAEFTQVGAAATLGALFHVPLFGIFAVEESPSDQEDLNSFHFPKSSKLLLYGLSIGAAVLVARLLSDAFGKAGEGFPSFQAQGIDLVDLALMLLYIPVGLLLYVVFLGAERVSEATAPKVPVVLREILAGLCVAVVGFLVPMVLSSGEDQMGELPEIYTEFGPVLLMGLAILKILMTAFCIRFGLKGGHFFPLIYACSLMGFGLCMLLFADPLPHAIFAAAVINGATLGAQMKKPLAVAMLLLISFPLRLVLVIFVAAAVGARIAALAGKRLRHSTPQSSNSAAE
jgi:H+/Cl- antiporter ClcA